MDEDGEVIAQVLRGTTAAFRFLVEKHQRVVWTFARNMLRNDADADDLTQDVFVAAFRNLPAFDASRAQFGTWLLTIARNRCCNVLKARMPLVDVPDDLVGSQFAPESFVTDGELWERLDRALERLPVEQRSAFVLAEIQELPYSDIAAIEGVELGTVKSRISRAKARLRDTFRLDALGEQPAGTTRKLP